MWPLPPPLLPSFLPPLFICFCRKRELLWTHNAKVWQEGSICCSWGWCGRGAGGQKGNGPTEPRHDPALVLPVWARLDKRLPFFAVEVLCWSTSVSTCCRFNFYFYRRGGGEGCLNSGFLDRNLWSRVFISHLLLKIKGTWFVIFELDTSHLA